ncbi:MAG: formyl transferase [Anaerolineae bacterium]|jgi:methionyl-tRNA formyltransferase
MDFAFLVLEEHPYGREMLHILLARGFRPELVVQEVSDVAEEERQKFLTRIAGQPVPPTMAALISSGGIPHHQVDNHNDATCQEILAAYSPELLVLGGTRILLQPILAIPPWGTVNAHPGLLPRLRGSSSVGWALYFDLPLGSTIHFVDASIDTGPILLRRRLPVYRSDTYEALVRRTLTLSGELMAEALALLEAGRVQVETQDPSDGETLRVIPPDLLEQAKARLAAGRYSHFAEGDRGG